MYSFGTIKTATCLGGGVLLVRDPVLRARIRMRQDRYPIQPTGEYVRKLVKAALLLTVSPRASTSCSPRPSTPSVSTTTD